MRLKTRSAGYAGVNLETTREENRMKKAKKKKKR